MWGPIIFHSILRSQFFLSYNLPTKLMQLRDWYLFKPGIDGDRYITKRRTSYKVKNGTVTDCKISFVFSIRNIYPVGKITISYANAYLTLFQKRAGNTYPFRFITNSEDRPYSMENLGEPETFRIDFISEEIGKPPDEAPNLGKQGKWRIDGVRVCFHGPLTFEKTVQPLKGFFYGKA